MNIHLLSFNASVQSFIHTFQSGKLAHSSPPIVIWECEQAMSFADEDQGWREQMICQDQQLVSGGAGFQSSL